MAEIPQFEHNGITIETNEPPMPMGPPGENVVAWIVTAPDKHEDIPYNVPYRIANFSDAQKLDKTGNELGTGWCAVVETLKKTQVPQYVIVVPEGKDIAATTAAIIGGMDEQTGKRTGIQAIVECPEMPTIIAAPGYSHQIEVVNALGTMAKRIKCRVVADGPSANTQQAVEHSKKLGGKGTGHDRVYVVEPSAYIYSRKAQGQKLVPASTIAVGALASVKLWESPGNQGVLIQNVQRVIDYNILDKSTEGDLLNRYGISYFARTSLGGFSLIGNRTVTGKFISFVGLEDAIARKLEKASQRAMAKQLTKSFMESEVRKIDLFMQDLVAAEIIPGGKVYLHPTLNTVERYKNGSWYIVVDYGRYSPNEHMIFHLNANDRIVEEFIEGVLA